ncbi:MAG TPA: EAL domain-containing protein [Accumulibacter sp.]|nr:EAL domain-containing protein [Accumulibacter sp.]HMX21680.1 EAL domain-containing protein [Accumulibacter sp.]HMY06676.1 EAL domain-containing protein [Accumulibacter sp.]HNC18392.1 EAL domain-containing protein [Accumulibacter sp.]HND80753.1 EAL domain-containing protein [Accumulibacter sp.]
MRDKNGLPPAKGVTRFLSLKWKVLLTLGVIMLSVNGALSWQHFNDLRARFDSQRAATRERLINEAQSLRTDFGRHLQALASMLAALNSLDTELLQSPSGRELLNKLFESYWSALQLDLGIDSLQIYPKEGPPIGTWSTSASVLRDQEAYVRNVIAHERAIYWTDCQKICSQFAAAPMLVAGEASGAVVLSSSLAELVVSFNRISGADLGVLAATAANGENMLSGIGFQVLGISNAENNLPLLQKLTAIPPLINGRAWHALSHQGKNYELTFLTLNDTEDQSTPALLVIVDDLTQALADIRAAVWRRLFGEMLTSLLSLGLLGYLVHGPLQRMAKAGQAIPLLGRGAFAEARQQIVPRKQRMLTDEIDILDEVAIALSHRLETLEKDIAAQASQMETMLKRISVERDFRQNLLDTAQVIILTQNVDGRILSLNRYGQMLLGWGADELLGKRFFEVIDPGTSSHINMQQALRGLAGGGNPHIQVESMLIGASGQSYEITWNHSRLSGRAAENLVILSVGIDHTERKRAESHVNYLAEHDPLTGLINRQHFQNELQHVLANSRYIRPDGALLYLDLDGFKYVNDLSGHQAGDALLRIVADEVGRAVESNDFLGRLGGDELGVFLRDCHRERAIEVAEDINRRLAEIKFPGFGTNHRVSASIGIVVFSETRMEVKALLANADIAMYQAKSVGGAGWHIYSDGEGVQEKMQSRLYWEEMINDALADNGLVVYYQPILDLRTQQVSHYEALVRMRTLGGPVILPGMFMEIAEDSGLIREIDRNVIRQVFSKLESLFAAGKNDYKFSINLSGVSINDPRLLAFIHDELARHPLMPGAVIFEITETAAVSDFSAARTFMNAVRELGCAFALDDFGVGFSSFSYVKQLPVDYVKIDGSFVRTLAENPDDQVFVRALAEVARGFGKQTIAEFVEDELALQMVRDFGIDYAQGYFVGKPRAKID